VKLSLGQGQTSPAWVQELLDSGYLTEVHKFSKFIHGTCTLMPEMVQVSLAGVCVCVWGGGGGGDACGGGEGGDA
jgi:hypothetical protein